jgi:hypothetical protein
MYYQVTHQNFIFVSTAELNVLIYFVEQNLSEAEVCGITKLVLYIHYILYKFKTIFCLVLHMNVSREPQVSAETGLACTKEHHLR